VEIKALTQGTTRLSEFNLNFSIARAKQEAKPPPKPGPKPGDKPA